MKGGGKSLSTITRKMKKDERNKSNFRYGGRAGGDESTF